MGFASILKDGTGKPSGYRMCDGEIAYMPQQQSYEKIFRKVNIDPKTMEVLSRDFIKDHRRVYRRGVLLRGISPEGFHCFNPAYIGNHQVIYTPYGDAKVAHPETFEVLDDGLGKFGPEGYGRDAEFVYFFTCSTDTCHAVRLRGCKNPSAFSLLPSGYAKDDAHVYYSQAIVKQALPDSFAVLKDGYARDDRHVFWRNQLLKTNVRDFTILGDGYAKDGNQVFYHDRLLPADSSAFSLLGDSYASDGTQIFGEGTLLDARSEAFALLGDGYACDSQHIFCGNRILDADRASFKVLGDGYAEDGRQYFSHGVPSGTKPPISG